MPRTVSLAVALALTLPGAAVAQQENEGQKKLPPGDSEGEKPGGVTPSEPGSKEGQAGERAPKQGASGGAPPSGDVDASTAGRHAETDPGAPPPASSDETPSVVAPRVLKAAPAVYPAELASDPNAPEGTVRLAVTVSESGVVTEVEVTSSVSPELDVAAISAVRQWVFAPASRNGAPMAARISVAVPFTRSPAPTEPSSVPAPSSANDPAEGPALPARGVNPTEFKAPTAMPPEVSTTGPTEVVVVGEQNFGETLRSSSDFSLKHDVLDAAPHHEGVDVLRAAPGLYIARPEGAAVAHRYMLRGFDSEHGQDIEFRVGGVPINLPSHIHGQGYADLGFLVGDSVSELRVTEGVHDPRQGDFAVAGSIDVTLGMTKRGVKVRSGYGSFGTYQQLVSWAPPDALPDTFGVVEVQTTDGFGDSRAGNRANVLFQQGFTWLDWRVRPLGIFHAARAQMPGVLRRDDVDSGAVEFYGAYPYPTAQAQNAMNLRGILGVFGEYQGLLGDTAELGLWSSRDRFRIQQNWTGFLERSQTLANVAGRGDLIEQRNDTDSVGLSARYRTAAKELGPFHTHLAVGAMGRLDAVDQQQNLLDAGVNSQTWDNRIDASIVATDIGTWLDADVHVRDWAKVRLGYRADLLGYEIDDRLGNRAPAIRASDSYIVGYRRSATGIAHGPRVSADIEPLDGLTIHGSYGEGFRSPQARTLADGEPAPFSKVHSADLGTRLALGADSQLTLSAYHTQLSDDVAFDATEGRLERVGATVRQGGVVHVETRPMEGVVGAFSVTYVDAELREPPPATAEEPNPPFQRGQKLPFVPPLVARADLGAERELSRWIDTPLTAKAGLGVSALSSRPLPYGYFGQAFALVDASVGLGVGPAQLTFSVFNLLDTQYPASEYSFVSNWQPEGPPSRVPVRHVVAGAPRTLLLSLEVNL